MPGGCYDEIDRCGDEVVAALDHGRNIGRKLAARRAGDSQAPQAAVANVRQQLRQRREHHLDRPAQQVGDRRTAAAIGHVAHVDPGLRLQQLAFDMRQ